MSDCVRGPATAGTCVRGTAGCSLEHAEPTLLEKLDAAEKALATAERRLHGAQGLYRAVSIHPGPHTLPLQAVNEAVADVNAASARCMAAAARCLVTTEDISDGPVRA